MPALLVKERYDQSTDAEKAHVAQGQRCTGLVLALGHRVLVVASAVYGYGLHMPVNISPAMTWIFIFLVTVSKLPQNPSNGGSTFGRPENQ
jgi:hypothetical protein